MSATEIYLISVTLFVLGKWAKKSPAATVQNVCVAVFGAFAFTLLDNGKMQRDARLLAWLIFTVAALTAVSGGVLKAVVTPATASAPKPAVPAKGAAPATSAPAVNQGA